MDFVKMMKSQANYNNKKFGDSLTEEEKRNISRDLALNSYNSINRMIEKMRVTNDVPHEDDLVYSSIDVLRYIMSMLNLWDVNPNDVATAFVEKDIFLDVEHKINTRKWEGQPVIIVDMDDVLVEFRSTFASFLKETYNLDVDTESEQYFFVNEILAAGNLNPEKVFESFVNTRSFRTLPLIEDADSYLSAMREKGYWIQLLTARPKEELKIFYDTYYWLGLSNIPFDRVDFSPEKLRWCMNSEYYDSGAIAFAIDDSPKHAMEYAGHGISVKVPLKSYNKSIESENITFYNNFNELLSEENNAD